MRPLSVTFITPSFDTPLDRPLLAFPVSAGFPSPADDYLEGRIDLNEHPIKHQSATFFVRVSGDSMTGAVIQDGDVLIVDRAAECVNNCIVLARINDGFTPKRFRKEGDRVFLVPENHLFQTIEITDGSDFEIWGHMTGTVRKY